MKHLLFYFFSFSICIISAKAQNHILKADTACCYADSISYFEHDYRLKTQYIRQPSLDTKDIILDFRAKALGIPKDLKIKKGEFIRVKVVNYNPFLYRVSIDNKDSSISQPNNDALLGFFLSPDKLSGIVANIVSGIGAPPTVVEEINTQQFSLTELNNKKVKTTTLIPTSDFENKANVIIDLALNDIKKKKESIRLLRKEIEAKLAIISKEFANLEQPSIKCNDLNEKYISEKAKDFDTDLYSFLERSRKINDSVFDAAKDFKFKLALYTGLLNRNAELKTKQFFIDSFYKMANAELLAFDSVISPNKINEIYTAFLKLAKNTPCYTSLPIYINGDVKTISISLNPVDEKSNLASYETSFSLPTYQPKIWGVTGGFFFSGLHNETYSNKRKPNDTTYNLVSDGQGKTQIGVNALVYTGTQIGSNSNYAALAFGAGMSLESKPKPRILLGASFITGDKNKLLFTLGYTRGFVSKLSDAFNTTDNYTKPAENYQKDIYAGSMFISINYSFLNK